LDVDVFLSGFDVKPINAFGLSVPSVKDNLGVIYDSKEYIVEFHPGSPSLVILDESVAKLLFILLYFPSTKLKVPLPDFPSSPFEPVSPCCP
jgi:hypothetical protein